MPVTHSADELIAELRAAEARYRLIAEAMPQFVWIDAPDGSAVYANQRWLDYIGMTAEENAGFGWTITVHPDDAARLDPLRKATLESGEDFEGECRYRAKDGRYRWYLFRSIAVRDESGEITSWIGTATDIDRQKRAEAQQTFFALASERLGSTLDEHITLERIAELCVPVLADWCHIQMMGDDGALRTTIIKHSDPGLHAALQRSVGHCQLLMSADLGAAAVVRTGIPELVESVPEDRLDLIVAKAADRELFAQAGLHSVICVPLRIGDDIVGTLSLISADPTRVFSVFDLNTAMELARRGSIAIAHSRLFAREHQIATTLQRALLPGALPHFSDVRFSSAYTAAVSGDEVGGDWYDAFELNPQCVAISIGDVAGHGLDAAVTMAAVRQAIRTAALEAGEPAQVLNRANAILTLDSLTPMVTAIFALYNRETRELRYAIAGHPRPILIDRDGGTRELHGAGTPLGPLYLPDMTTTHSVQLPEGASLVLFTDGLIEYDRDLDRALARLHETLARRLFVLSENPAQSIISTVLDAPQRDDIAVLVMSLNMPDETIEVALPARPQSAALARELLRRFAAHHGLDDERTFNILCAGGEAISNAIEHPRGNREGVFHLRAEHRNDAVYLEVRDHGSWRNTISVDRGRGYTIMRAIAKSCAVRRDEGGTRVALIL